MLVGICLGSLGDARTAGAGLLTAADARQPGARARRRALTYAVLGLTSVSFSVSARAEPWLSPADRGVATGLVTAATGVYVIPAVPYLQALRLEQDELVQALRLFRSRSRRLALAAILTHDGALETSIAGRIAVGVGSGVDRHGGWAMGASRVRPDVFRVCFLLGLLLLGAHLALRGAL